MPLRLGVIGYGNRIHGVVNKHLRTLCPDARVVAVVDPDEAGARARLAECDRADVTFYPSLGALVRRARVDGLLIGTRCNLHTPYAIQAAKHDLPLYLEKPVAIDMPQATALERAFRKSRCRVVVSFPLRLSPLAVLTRRRIEEGAIGTPEHILGVNFVSYGINYYYAHAGYRNFAITRGLFLQKATHDLDYMSMLMGSNVIRVAAMHTRGRVFGGRKSATLRCSRCGQYHTCPESPEARRNYDPVWAVDHLCPFSRACGTPATGMNEDSSSALLEFASGVHGVYTQVFFARRDAGSRGATVTGYKGTLRFDWQTNELRYVRHHAPFSDTTRGDTVDGHGGGDAELVRDFRDLMEGRKRESRSTIRHGLQSVYACLAAQASAEKGRFVDVRQAQAG